MMRMLKFIMVFMTLSNTPCTPNFANSKVSPFALLCRRLRRPINTDVSTLHLAKVLQQEASLEIRVWMQDRVEFACWPEGSVFHLCHIVVSIVPLYDCLAWLILPF